MNKSVQFWIVSLLISISQSAMAHPEVPSGGGKKGYTPQMRGGGYFSRNMVVETPEMGAGCREMLKTRAEKTIKRPEVVEQVVAKYSASADLKFKIQVHPEVQGVAPIQVTVGDVEGGKFKGDLSLYVIDENTMSVTMDIGYIEFEGVQEQKMISYTDITESFKAVKRDLPDVDFREIGLTFSTNQNWVGNKQYEYLRVEIRKPSYFRDSVHLYLRVLESLAHHLKSLSRTYPDNYTGYVPAKK